MSERIHSHVRACHLNSSAHQIAIRRSSWSLIFVFLPVEKVICRPQVVDYNKECSPL